MKNVPSFFVEVTDTYGGEANYCWVRRYLVRASTMRGAMGKVPGYSWRTDGAGRYNAIGACVCAFIEWVDVDDIKRLQDNYSNIEVI